MVMRVVVPGADVFRLAPMYPNTTREPDLTCSVSTRESQRENIKGLGHPYAKQACKTFDST